MRNTNQLTQKEQAYFNKCAREWRKANDNFIKDCFAYFGAHKEIGEDIRPLLKARGIKTRVLKKDNSNWREVVKAHYTNKQNEIINALQELINNKETSEQYAIDELKEIEVRTTWARSRVWGWNPTSTVFINNRLAGTGSASGCGYDKQSAAINTALRDNLIFKRAIIIKAIKTLCTGASLPYGVTFDRFGIYASFGGCGVSTFVNILKWLGINTRVIGRDSDYIITVA